MMDLLMKILILILGNKINVDGTLSERLTARLEKGIELYHNSLIDTIFVTGGLGKEGFYEGDKMADFLINNGIPNNRIVIDNYGNNTFLSAKNFKSQFPNEISVTLITQYYHISRSKLLFRKLGIQEVKGVHCHFFEMRDFYSCFREFFGYYYYLMK